MSGRPVPRVPPVATRLRVLTAVALTVVPVTAATAAWLAVGRGASSRSVLLVALVAVVGSALVAGAARAVETRLTGDLATLSGAHDALAVEQAEALRLHQLALDMARTLHCSPDLPGALRLACSRLGEELRVDRVVLITLDTGQHLRRWEQWHGDDVGALPPPPPELVSIVQPVSHDLLYGSSRVVPDLFAPGTRQDAVVGELRRFAGARGLLLVPVGATDHQLGLLACITVDRPRPWPDHEVRAVEQLSAIMAQAIVQQRLLEVQDLQVRELRALDQHKDTFLATVSHELRTPLTSIGGYLEIIRDGDLGAVTSAQAAALDVIGRNSDRLRGLIEDLLVLNRMETAGLRGDPGPVDLGALLATCVELLRPTAEAAGVELVAAAAGPLGVHGHAGQLERALLNVLGNAVKFTPSGGTVVLDAHDTGGSVVVEVADTGIGIPGGDLERLCDRFFRAGNATASAIPGTGLGLAIVRGVVEQHGGEVAFSSEEGRGTTVRLRFPAVPLAPSPGNAPTARAV